MKNSTAILLAVALFSAFIFLQHGLFSACFRDDVEFAHGKHTMKKKRQSEKSVFKRFIFWYIRDDVTKFHYICFWISLLSLPLAAICMVCQYIQYIKWRVTLSSIGVRFFGAVFFASLAVAAFSHFELYRGNKVRNRKQYKRKSK